MTQNILLNSDVYEFDFLTRKILDLRTEIDKENRRLQRWVNNSLAEQKYAEALLFTVEYKAKTECLEGLESLLDNSKYFHYQIQGLRQHLALLRIAFKRWENLALAAEKKNATLRLYIQAAQDFKRSRIYRGFGGKLEQLLDH